MKSGFSYSPCTKGALPICAYIRKIGGVLTSKVKSGKKESNRCWTISLIKKILGENYENKNT